jgi:hypothetical protein
MNRMVTFIGFSSGNPCSFHEVQRQGYAARLRGNDNPGTPNYNRAAEKLSPVQKWEHPSPRGERNRLHLFLVEFV